MKKNTSFTEGKIMQPLLLFAVPVLLALFLQAMYSAVDLLIVGKFASSADVSAVSTGSQIMTTLTNLVSSLMNAPEEAFQKTVDYIRTCGGGCLTRARKALHYGIAVSFSVGVIMFVITFFHGDILAGIFSSDPEVIAAAADYLKAYAIDCLFTAIADCQGGCQHHAVFSSFAARASLQNRLKRLRSVFADNM